MKSVPVSKCFRFLYLLAVLGVGCGPGTAGSVAVTTPMGAPVAVAPDAGPPDAASADAAPAIRGEYRVSAKISEGLALVVPEIPCVDPPCRLEPLTLGPAKNARLEGLLDLMGPPRELYQRSFGGTGLEGSLLPAAEWPVAVLFLGNEAKGGATNSMMVLVSLRGGSARILLAVEMSSSHPDGGGFQTIDTIRFDRRTDGEPLALSFVQTAMPRRGAQQFRPGPPLGREFRIEGENYVRVR